VDGQIGELPAAGASAFPRSMPIGGVPSMDIRCFFCFRCNLRHGDSALELDPGVRVCRAAHSNACANRREGAAGAREKLRSACVITECRVWWCCWWLAAFIRADVTHPCCDPASF